MSKSLKMPELFPKVSKGKSVPGLTKESRGRRKDRVRDSGGKSSRRVGR